MKNTIKIDFKQPKRKEIGLIVDFLRQGKTMVYPTDTIYGLGCLATDQKAIAKIYRIKQREKKKPLLVLISDLRMLKRFFVVDKSQSAYLKEVWPGPVSVILKKKSLLPDVLSGGLEGVAVRLPKNDFLVKMIRKAGEPIVSTSLNLSQQEVLTNVDNIDRYFKSAKPDLIVDIGRDLKGKPSRLIDLRDPSAIKVIRP